MVMKTHCSFSMLLAGLLVLLHTCCGTDPPRPHIIIIVADDLGFNDVGFHGSTQIPTPNIDALAYSGIILNNYYVQPICTPSRSALLTGKYPIHTGLNHDVIYAPQPYGIPLEMKLLPQHLVKLGYVTRHVGKWHLGMAIQELTPTYRGFMSHFGYWTGHQDYYDHTTQPAPGYWGYDMRRNMTVAKDCYGKYTTDLFTDEAVDIIKQHNTSQPLFLYLAHLAVHSGNPYAPLQAPKEVVEKFSYINDENRRIFAGMLWKLDESVGQVIEALDARQMLENSIILFTTDNGGPAAGFNQNAASNWPLRGVKASLWEGGVRGAGVLWSPFVLTPGRVADQMVHITDWLPTLISAAGGNITSLGPIDGVDLWSTLTQNLSSPRTEFLVNIDPILNGAAVRVGDWKLIYKPQGYGHHWDGWFGPSGRNETAPETNLDVILKQVLNSSVARAVKALNPQAYQDIESLRLKAEIHCNPVPENATAYCKSSESPCLFNILSDPCEYFDLAAVHKDVLSVLEVILKRYNATAVPPANKPWDTAANPKYWDYTWTNWKDFNSPIVSDFDKKYEEYNKLGDMYNDAQHI
ncbi:arylsulfatase B isoform X1 [Procambarus clarkii]|uniref:arylsulfatase B isoform X1 n=1 Tax=Procambarus clarkii TaxID=6728 RepID=UPI0037435134